MNATTAPVWAELTARAGAARDISIRALFDGEPDRLKRLCIAAPHVFLDASKEPLDRGAHDALLRLAAQTEALGFLQRAVRGDVVNSTEGRAALHTALRADTPPASIAGAIRDANARMHAFRRDLLSGAHAGADGKKIKTIVHIGIGGSDLGPRLVLDALKRFREPGIDVRFAANIDGADIVDALEGLDPRETLVLIVSKTFTTLETLTNGAYARDWLRAGLGQENVSRHLAAITAAPQKAIAWGVGENAVFPFWDWVGGRYSLWSAVGLSTMIALQEGAFDALKRGAAAMDDHALNALPEANAPLLSALCQTWRRLMGRASIATIPYSRRLALLPAWLQQLEMESNGKSVTRDGDALPMSAAAITWGDVGANAQHSFFQLLHQGYDSVPVDFIVIDETEGAHAHRVGLHANALAQAEALLMGKTRETAEAELLAAGMAPEAARALSAHKTFPGNRGSTIIGLKRIAPESLGALLAFFEHRTVLGAALMGINPFDQWGVELGKQLAVTIADGLQGRSARLHDPSTSAWIARLGQTAQD
jgi:glucose-6-phosphate isomerase